MSEANSSILVCMSVFRSLFAESSAPLLSAELTFSSYPITLARAARQCSTWAAPTSRAQERIRDALIPPTPVEAKAVWGMLSRLP